MQTSFMDHCHEHVSIFLLELSIILSHLAMNNGGLWNLCQT